MENAVQYALMPILLLPTQKPLEWRVLKENQAQEERGDFQAHLEEMVSLDNLDLQAHLALQALAETLLLSCLMVMMKNLWVAFLFLAQWVPLVPVVLPVLLVHLVPKISKVPLVNPESLVLLVQWVPVVQPAHLERTEMTVKLVNLAVLASVVLQAHRVPVAFPELLACQA